MRVCLFAEGCYPYVVGGVSGWIQTLLNGLPDIEFLLYTIAVDEEQRGKFKYTLPPNVVHVHENFFWPDMSANPGRRGKRRRKLTRRESEVLRPLVLSEAGVDWKAVYQVLRAPGFDAGAYLNGHAFLDVAKERYRRDAVKSAFSDYLWTLRSMFKPLLTILSKELPEADVYHSVSAGYAGVMGALGAAVYDRPFVLCEHGIYTREREEELIRSKWTKGYLKDMWIAQFYMLSRFAYDQAVAVVSLFHKNAEIQAELGCDPDKIRIIRNAVSVGSGDEQPPLWPDEGTVRVGAVVRVTPIKDIKTMILAFHQARQRMKHLQFYIMGPTDEDPEYYEECVDLLKQLGAEGIELTGRIRIQEYVPNMDILVLTSISEGQPLAILEGMLFRKPWVCTNVGCCHELMYGSDDDTEGQAGYIAPVMDVQEIARCICRLADDREGREQMGENGYRRVNRHYRLEDMFGAYRALYYEAAGLPLPAAAAE